MIHQARNFAEVVKANSNPVSIFALTSDYQSTVPLPQMQPPDSIARLQQRATLEDLGKAYLKFRDYKANLEFFLTSLLSLMISVLLMLRS